MTALLIDTSSDTAFLGLIKNGIVIDQKTIPEVRQLSKFLLPSIKALWQDGFDYIALGIGPGSYTGTRVGAAIAKTLSFALDIPAVGFSSEILPDLDKIARFSFENYQSRAFSAQIELVYFSSTL